MLTSVSKLLPTISGFPLGEGSHGVKARPGQDSVWGTTPWGSVGTYTQHRASKALEYYRQALTQVPLGIPLFLLLPLCLFFFFPKWLHYLFLPLPEDMLIDFFPEGEKQKHQCDRETLIHCLSHMLPQGPNPQTFGLWDDAPTN